MFCGYGKLHSGNIDGEALVREGLRLFRNNGARWALPYWLGTFAGLLRDREEDAKVMLEEAFDVVAAIEERWFEPELYRLRGDLCLSAQARRDPGEDYSTAMRLAEQQGSKLLELRAAESLARLYLARGKAKEARALLAQAYHWFTEGFETPQLKKTKALLDHLS